MKKTKTAKTATAEAPAPPPPDPVEVVIARYKEKGWTTIRANGGQNDIIANSAPNKHGKTKMHFIQVMTPETAGDARYSGESRGQFVQNAFSNSAEPIHAVVNARRGISLTNVNSGTAVRL